MIKIGTLKEIYKAGKLPSSVRESVIEDVATLDFFYGDERNVDNDMGGFVIICDADEKLHIKNFSECLEQAEYIQDIFPFRKALYIAGTERNIIIYRRMK